MAGSYPDAPGLRMAWDRDGSVGFRRSSPGSLVIINAAARVALNSENGTQGGFPPNNNNQWYGVVFPEPRDVSGLFIGISDPSVVGPTITELAYSTNTTNGDDGTWTSVSTSTGTFLTNTGLIPKANMRNTAAAVSWSSVRGVRCRTGSGAGGSAPYTFHIYGKPSAGENPNRLRFWHPTNDAEVGGAHFDIGDEPRGESDTRQFRIKNNSSTLTANSIDLTREALTDTTPTNVGQIQFSDDNITYVDSLNIGNLAPGAVSSVLYVRRDTSASAALSLWWVRFIAAASSFS